MSRILINAHHFSCLYISSFVFFFFLMLKGHNCVVLFVATFVCVVARIKLMVHIESENVWAWGGGPGAYKVMIVGWGFVK